MARVNFRQIENRFTHIDAEFVRSECDLPSGSALLEVEIYPWWEHPKYIEAVSKGLPWGFADLPRKAYKRVVVHAIGLVEAKLSERNVVIDWAFLQDDPMLWKFEDSTQVMLNQPLLIEEWLAVQESLRIGLQLPNLNSLLALGSLERVVKFGSTPSFSLGVFPHSVLVHLRIEFERRKIDFQTQRETSAKPMPVLFQFQDDYIIANDFEVEVPEFEHKDEWFKVT